MYSAVRRTLNDVEGAEEILSGYFFPALAHGIGIRFGPAGFPNGRRLADDVVDIALRVAVGGVLTGNQRRASHNSSNCNVLPNNALADGVNVDEVNTDLATDGVANFKVKSLLVSGLGIPFSSARVKVHAARCVAPKIHSGGQRNLGLDLEGRLPAFPSGSSVCFKSERM